MPVARIREDLGESVAGAGLEEPQPAPAAVVGAEEGARRGLENRGRGVRSKVVVRCRTDGVGARSGRAARAPARTTTAAGDGDDRESSGEATLQTHRNPLYGLG